MDCCNSNNECSCKNSVQKFTKPNRVQGSTTGPTGPAGPTGPTGPSNGNTGINLTAYGSLFGVNADILNTPGTLSFEGATPAIGITPNLPSELVVALSGLYQITATYQTSPGTASALVQVNGVSIENSLTSTSFGSSASTTIQLPLNAGDRVSLFAQTFDPGFGGIFGPRNLTIARLGS
ncbi:hypothetical protein JOC54_003122 [Alkalihalobacillus xiaoxiensis]|uniref:BclA C-terminal domain-containing protein n=1 Tax=Shouchella xiaoxiensis TaxID=766895 RepID=A0ABS2SWD5_9BACI|nr:hypothetical protein [Shouchella xiaoxiensis]MBM7839842.1 hypothetical protein [Shouchella xiaoxiensis]